MFKGRPVTPPMWPTTVPDVSARDAAIARLEAEVERLEAEVKRLRKQHTVRPMETAPRDGTRIMAYWPYPLDSEPSDAAGWVTTWWGRTRDQLSDGWENCWEWECPEGEYEPIRWLPHPEAEEDTP